MRNVAAEPTLAEFIRYNNWANQQLLAACRHLSQEQLDAALPGGYGSIRSTLEHIIEGEAFYVELLTGRRPEPPFQWETRPDVAQMMEYAAGVGDALAAAAHHVSPVERICEVDGDEKFYYEALVVFIQVINHGVEHRTNITSILSAEGQPPPAVDGWGYLTAHQARFDYEAE